MRVPTGYSLAQSRGPSRTTSRGRTFCCGSTWPASCPSSYACGTAPDCEYSHGTLGTACGATSTHMGRPALHPAQPRSGFVLANGKRRCKQTDKQTNKQNIPARLVLNPNRPAPALYHKGEALVRSFRSFRSLARLFVCFCVCSFVCLLSIC